MVRLYDTIDSYEILQTLSVKLSWSHLLKLITIDDPLKREFYITMCEDLKALNENNKMSTDLFFRDPYVLDFLGLKDT